MAQRFRFWDGLQACRNTIAVTSMLTLFHASNALAQVRPTPMGTSDADVMIGREWAGYFIGGFLLLIVLIVIRNNQKQKQKDKKQAARHHRHMEKIKEERRQAAAQSKPPPE